jgi:hypothetical protein
VGHQADLMCDCRKRLLQMPELEREMELTRRKESQEDAELLKQIAKQRKPDGDAEDDSAKDVRPSCPDILKTGVSKRS